VLPCYDRVIVQGTLPVCLPGAPSVCKFYCAGHNWLARQLDGNQISYTLLDNAFTRIEDFAAAQQLADGWEPSRFRPKLDGFAERYCPILKQIEESYHWSLDEAE
jgi:hypothetical protein